MAFVATKKKEGFRFNQTHGFRFNQQKKRVSLHQNNWLIKSKCLNIGSGIAYYNLLRPHRGAQNDELIRSNRRKLRGGTRSTSPTHTARGSLGKRFLVRFPQQKVNEIIKEIWNDNQSKILKHWGFRFNRKTFFASTIRKLLSFQPNKWFSFQRKKKTFRFCQTHGLRFNQQKNGLRFTKTID